MSDLLNNLRFPGGLDEGDLLSWIEGEPLAASRRAAIAAWLAREPELAAQVEAMRSDRQILRGLGDVKAPAGLLDAVAGQLEPVLERQMLLGLADGKDLMDSPPVSVVRPQRSGVLASIFADPSGRRIALAAGLLLVVGGTTYFMAQALTRPVKLPRPAHTIALNEAPREVTPPAPESLPAETFASKAEDRGALPPEAVPLEPVPSTTFAEATRLAQYAESEPEMELAGAIEPPAMGPFIPEGVDAVRAAELASEGRLVIRVKSEETSLVRNPERVALRLRKAPLTDRLGWNVEGEAPAALASAVATPFPQDAPLRLREPAPIVIAGDLPERYRDVELPKLYGPPEPELAEVIAQGPTVYSVQLRLEPVNLSKLKDTLRDIGGEVVFEEADAPLPETGEPALSPQAILWWGQRPEGWAKWGRVPVVVDVQR